jgi:hypothetical protein
MMYDEYGPRESGDLVKDVCPSCDPQADPIRELVRLVPCDEHRPDTRGVDDALASAVMDIGRSGAELSGEEAARACRAIHRAT